MLKLLVLSLGVLLALARPPAPSESHEEEGHHDQGHGKGSSSEKDNKRPGQCPAGVVTFTGLDTLSTPSPDCVNGTNCTSPGTLPTSAPDCSTVTAQSCSIDSTCQPPQKCCQTNCGARCLDPISDKVCNNDADCAAEAEECCKEGTCSSDCGSEEEED